MMNTAASVTPFPLNRLEPVRLSCAETAVMVRAALKAAFPGVTFSVKSKTYSGGASITIRWTDGPTYDEGQRVAGRFAGASFDGMIDLKNYHDSMVDGRLYRFGADYIFCSRDISATLLARAVRYANQRYGWTLDDTHVDLRGPYYGIGGGGDPIDANGRYATKADRVYQIARTMRPNGCIVRLK